MLTPKEIEVLALVALGYLDKQIANKLGLSYSTVRGHIDKAVLKLNARNRTHAVIIYKFMNKDWLEEFFNYETHSLKAENNLLVNYGRQTDEI